MQHIDLLTVKKEDLAFTAPFELTATRTDCTSRALTHPLRPRVIFPCLRVVPSLPAGHLTYPRDLNLLPSSTALALTVTPDAHAFLAWFDIVFQCTHKKVNFSTGPHAQYTHWK